MYLAREILTVLWMKLNEIIAKDMLGILTFCYSNFLAIDSMINCKID